jgi:hypothetical protein
MIIAQRGVQLLKTGGLMVYSTCSMSPYEDEAVIAELLRHFKGQLELVDAREFVPVFKARPGMSDWHVVDDALSVRKQASAKKFLAKKARYNKRMGIDGVEPEGVPDFGEASIYGLQPLVAEVPMSVEGQAVKGEGEEEEDAEVEEKGAHPVDGRETYNQIIPDDPRLGTKSSHFLNSFLHLCNLGSVIDSLSCLYLVS